MVTSYDGLYTLRCTASSSLAEAETTTELFESDATGNPLVRPEIDEADPLPNYAIRLDAEESCMHLVDPLSQGILATTTTLTPNKLRLITLHNPTLRVELKNKSLLSYEWAFRWGDDWRFIWNRSRDSLSASQSGYTLSISRKPDPSIAICAYRPGRKGSSLVQILDYNLSRFDIEDRKGLEIVILSTLFAIVHGDKLDEAFKADAGQAVAGPSTSPAPPMKRQASDEISPNEIIISSHLSERAYVDHCLNLLSDPNLIYISLVAKSADTVQRAISIASEVKRRHIKTSPNSQADLMQYIDYPGCSRRESNKDKTPPAQIKIYLSRIQLEEFTPQRPNSAGNSASEKDRLANHYRSQDANSAGRRPSPATAQSSSRSNIPTASLATGGARLQRPSGAPPLPAKSQAMKNDQDAERTNEPGRLRAFLSRAVRND